MLTRAAVMTLTLRCVAAAVTKRTAATAIVVSATDGNIRIFSGGKLVLQIDPNVAHRPITLDE